MEKRYRHLLIKMQKNQTSGWFQQIAEGLRASSKVMMNQIAEFIPIGTPALSQVRCADGVDLSPLKDDDMVIRIPMIYTGKVGVSYGDRTETLEAVDAKEIRHEPWDRDTVTKFLEKWLNHDLQHMNSTVWELANLVDRYKEKPGL